MPKSKRQACEPPAPHATGSQRAATIGHEMRLPMNAIVGMAQRMLMSDLEDAERRECARTILNSSRSLLALLNDMLDLPDQAREHTVFDPERLLNEISLLFSPQAVDKGLALSAVWRGPPRQRYRGDPVRLRRTLSSLVNHSIGLAPVGPLSIEATETSREKDAAVIRFSVTDAGIEVRSGDGSSLGFDARVDIIALHQDTRQGERRAPPVVATSTFDTNACASALNGLRPLMIAHRYQALEEFAQLEDKVRDTPFAPAVAAIRMPLRKLRFEAAVRELDTLAAELAERPDFQRPA